MAEKLTQKHIEAIRQQWDGDLHPCTAEFRALCDMALSSLREGQREGWQRGLLMEVRLCVESYRQKKVSTPGHLMYDQAHVPALLEKIDKAMLAASPASQGEAVAFDFTAHIERAKEFSERTFGPGHRSKGVVDHIRKELLEIEAAPLDLEEWVDVWMLALDGAWRTGATAAQIVAQIQAKQTKNEGRKWPDWRTADRDKGIEHDRSADAAPPSGSAAEPVAEICETWDRSDGAVEHYAKLFQHLPVGTKLYLAPPTLDAGLPQPPADEALNVIKELVAVEDFLVETVKAWRDPKIATKICGDMDAEYARRKPLTWAAARRYLAGRG